MNGYLQRLAASAIRPARSIHPVVGSRFSPTSRLEPMDSLEEIPVESSAAYAQPVVAPSEASSERPLVRTPPMQRRRRFSDAKTHGESDFFSPLLDSTEPATGTANLQASALSRDPDQQTTPGSDANPVEAMEDLHELRTGSASAGTEYHPLVQLSPRSLPPKTLTFSASHDLQQIRAAAAPQNSRSTDNSRRAHPPQPPREPDEIQIHIGRIEVTAVQPPVAPRPAPRESRKSINLDEYLRRRNGRS